MNPTTADSAAPSRSATTLFSGADSATGSDYEQYRSLSGAAVLSVILAVMSVVALLPDFWVLKVVPLLGVLAGASALGRIRRRPDELSGRKLAWIGTLASLALLTVGTAWSAYEHVTEIPEGYEPIDFSVLKHPDESRRVLPSPAAQALEGKKVFLRGYMYPTAHDKGVVQFVLCRDNGDCCFGGEPPPSDMVFVELKKPLQTTYSRKLRRVAGIFHVAGSHSADVKKNVLYQLDADYIK